MRFAKHASYLLIIFGAISLDPVQAQQARRASSLQAPLQPEQVLNQLAPDLYLDQVPQGMGTVTRETHKDVGGWRYTLSARHRADKGWQLLGYSFHRIGSDSEPVGTTGDVLVPGSGGQDDGLIAVGHDPWGLPGPDDLPNLGVPPEPDRSDQAASRQVKVCNAGVYDNRMWDADVTYNWDLVQMRWTITDFHVALSRASGCKG